LPPDAHARVLLTGQKWSGPALIALGLIVIAAVGLTANQSRISEWFLEHAFAPERVLPLLGLGVACALVGARTLGVTLLLFSLGIAGGFAARDWLILSLYNALGGPTYLFLTGPISCLAIGLALIPGARLRLWLLPIAALIEGAMLALAIFLTDPSLHDPTFLWASLLAAFWAVATVVLTLQAYWHRWFAIIGRIFGSWLLAIGFLYGGASLLPILNPAPPPLDTSRESTRGAELMDREPARPTTGTFSARVKRHPLRH
jgi:hypothetical protein